MRTGNRRAQQIAVRERFHAEAFAVLPRLLAGVWPTTGR
jgi:hypothetical protein